MSEIVVKLLKTAFSVKGNYLNKKLVYLYEFFKSLDVKQKPLHNSIKKTSSVN